MKYLKYDLYEKVCTVDSEYDDIWNEKCQNFMDEFTKIQCRLPKSFLGAFSKYHFHDNTLMSVSLRLVELKRRDRFDLSMELSEYHDNKTVHNLVFTDVTNFKANLTSYYDCTWLYCEILPIDEKRMSLEIAFCDCMLYFEFSKMHYKKSRR